MNLKSLLKKSDEADKLAFSPFNLGLILVFIFGLIAHFVFPLIRPELFKDGMITLLKDPFYFHELAIKTANASWANFQFKPEDQFPAGVLALIYKLTGVHQPYMMIPVLAFFAGLTIKTITSCLKLLGVTGRWWPLVIGVIFTVTPTSISWMIYPHQDAFIVPGVLLIAWSFISTVLRGFQWKNFFAFIWGAILIVVTKTYFSEILLLCSIFAVIVSLGIFKRHNLKRSLGVTYFFTFCSIIFLSISIFNSGYLKTATREKLGMPSQITKKDVKLSRHADSRKNWINIPGGKWINQPFAALAYTRERFLHQKSNGKTNFLPEIHLKSTIDTILYFPRALQLAFLEPLPFREYPHSLPRKIIFALSQVEMLFVYFSILFLIFSGKKAFTPTVFMCMAIAIPFLIVLGYGMPNIGSINRYRFPFLILIKMAGLAALWNSSRFKWPGRLLMWIDPPEMHRKKKKVLFLVPDDATFIIQRLVMAQGVQRAGYDVHVACPDLGHSQKIRELGFTFHKLDLNRGGLNPFADFIPFIRLVFFLAKERPDILQCVSIKPVIYGATAGTIVGLKRIVCLINGLGYAFEGNGIKGNIVLFLAKILYQNALSMPGVRVIFQNPDDQSYFIKKGLVDAEKTLLIRGSGVDMEKFRPTPLAENKSTIILFVARLLWSKGIRELFEAAKILKSEGLSFELKIVGSPDERNPEAVPESYLKEFHNKGIVNWVGRQTDMPKFYREADIVVLPTEYREGLPLTLLEAASTGRSLVTTNMPGCREIARDGINGFLVPIRDSRALADALRKLITNPELLKKFGLASSEIVSTEFSSSIVQQQLLKVYELLLNDYRLKDIGSITNKVTTQGSIP